MSTTRIFQLASSLARLIEKEGEGHRVRRGYFPDQPDRNISVWVDNHRGGLVLVSKGPDGLDEEAADLTLNQAEALLAYTAGQADYWSISLNLGPHAAAIQRFTAPSRLDLVTIIFEKDDHARTFQPPAWLGREVTGDRAYQASFLALHGLPAAPDVELTGEALDSLLDTLGGWSEGDGSSPSSAPDYVLCNLSLSLDEPESDVEDDLGIEDEVIRELARSLRPGQG
jgi:CYTH domain-containing protein